MKPNGRHRKKEILFLLFFPLLSASSVSCLFCLTRPGSGRGQGLFVGRFQGLRDLLGLAAQEIRALEQVQ